LHFTFSGCIASGGAGSFQRFLFVEVSPKQKLGADEFHFDDTPRKTNMEPKNGGLEMFGR